MVVVEGKTYYCLRMGYSFICSECHRFAGKMEEEGEKDGRGRGGGGGVKGGEKWMRYFTLFTLLRGRQ